MPRDPFAQPSLYSLAPTLDAGAAYDFQILVFLDDSPEPLLDQTFQNKNPAKDGTYITTFSTSSPALWNRKIRVFVTDLTEYKGNQPLLRIRADYVNTPSSTRTSSIPFNFVTKAFKHVDQRTIKIQADTVYRMEFHLAF